MKTFFISIWVISLVMALLGACGTTTGNFATSLMFKGTRPDTLNIARGFSSFSTSAEPVSLTVSSLGGTTSGTLTLSDARAVIKQIKLKRKESGLSEVEKEKDEQIRISGPFVIDLLANTATPALPNLTIDSGDYDRIEFKLDRIEGEEDGGSLVESSDPLFGNSLYFAGTYTGAVNGGTVTNAPFTLVFNFDKEFKLSAGSSAMGILSGAANPIIVAFRMVKWFAFHLNVSAQVDFSNVTASGGRIDLFDDSSGDNKKAWEAIGSAIKASADFGKDSDGDGKLEKDEDDDSDDDNDD